VHRAEPLDGGFAESDPETEKVSGLLRKYSLFAETISRDPGSSKDCRPKLVMLAYLDLYGSYGLVYSTADRGPFDSEVGS
jgi:hypothetical protein